MIIKRATLKDFIFYKSNAFTEPCKRIDFNHSSLNTFETQQNQFVIFVKIDGGFLNIEAIEIILYIPLEYPNKLEKVSIYQAFMNWSLKETLNNVILHMNQENIFSDVMVEKYHFQLFNKASNFLMPG